MWMSFADRLQGIYLENLHLVTLLVEQARDNR